MSSKTQTQTPIPIPTVFNSRLIAPGLLQFKPLTCCRCNYTMPDTEWRCNHCGHDHKYMGDDRREEKYVYFGESNAEVKGDERGAWRDAVRKVLLGRNTAIKKDIAEGKKKRGQGVVLDTLDYDENGNWVLGGEPVRFDGAGRISGTHEHGEGNGKKKGKKTTAGEAHAQLKQRRRKDGQQQDGIRGGFFGKLFHRSGKSPARSLHASGSSPGLVGTRV